MWIKVLNLDLNQNKFGTYSNSHLKRKLMAKILNPGLKKKPIIKILKKIGTIIAN